ncbi:Sb-PDE family phosphodiesterase [Mariniphaga sediminis]|uniref:Sb-PDE family phosphodiesterase n=1 Tax=Mariniphaga sediminis TaxID=1628158 RepID=UPI003566DC94
MRLKISVALLLFFSVTLYSSGQSRKIIHIPDIPGYKTLKCDFHIHTVFSDGTVWPTVRVEEAWQEGLDAIAITDHIEYRPHSKDVVADHNRSYEIAEPLAKNRNILLVRGAEITRNMPPGHLNALFIRNANLLERDDVFEAIKEARDQGAFILWNHPGWKAQQPDSTLWWEEHTRLLQNDMLHGIEAFNYNEHYPEAIDWAREKNLSVFANSDIHEPVSMAYDLTRGFRPMTLVFARSRTEGGIKEALFSRRTAALYNNTLVGKAELLDPLFFASLKIYNQAGKLQLGETKKIGIENRSALDYELELVQPGVGFDAPESVTLKAHRVTLLELNGNSEQIAGMNELKVFYKVKNLMVSSSENLVITFVFANN